MPKSSKYTTNKLADDLNKKSTDNTIAKSNKDSNKEGVAVAVNPKSLLGKTLKASQNAEKVRYANSGDYSLRDSSSKNNSGKMADTYTGMSKDSMGKVFLSKKDSDGVIKSPEQQKKHLKWMQNSENESYESNVRSIRKKGSSYGRANQNTDKDHKFFKHTQKDNK